MKSIHLSDLHFNGNISRRKIETLADDILGSGADLVIVTGDVTDRGRVAQFKLARDFLKSLRIPFIVVPGNREISVGAFWEWTIPRFSMMRYKHFFGDPDKVLYHPDGSDTVFFGLNSVHFLPAWPGTIRRATRHWLKEQAARFPDCSKVLFLHHPVLPVIRSSSYWAHILSEAGEMLNICSQYGITLILQGHKHRSAVMEISLPERNAKVVVSSCGAPLLSRWDSVYHIIEINRASIIIQQREFLEKSFAEKATYVFSFDK